MTMQNGNYEDGPDSGLATGQAKNKKPPLYKVIMLNDDYTPMEFVVLVLQDFLEKHKKKPPRSCFMCISAGLGFAVFIRMK